MKILLGVAAAILMLSACSSQSVQQSAEPANQGQVKNQQDDHKENKKAGEKTQEKTKPPKTEAADPKKEDTQQSKGEASKKKKKVEKKQQPKPKPKYYMAKNYFIKPISDADPKVVLLTIDDAPDQHAVEMAETLKKLHAKAIFFIMGDLIESQAGKEKVKKIHDMGFPVGNHTYDHPFLSHLSKEKQRKELIPVYKELKQITGEPVKFFRAPHGDNTDVSNELAAERGVLAMNWSYGYDWHQKYENPKALTHIMLNPEQDWMLSNGAILLMHDRPWTAKALPDIVKGLRKKGFTILDPALLRIPEPQ